MVEGLGRMYIRLSLQSGMYLTIEKRRVKQRSMVDFWSDKWIHSLGDSFSAFSLFSNHHNLGTTSPNAKYQCRRIFEAQGKDEWFLKCTRMSGE